MVFFAPDNTWEHVDNQRRLKIRLEYDDNPKKYTTAVSLHYELRLEDILKRNARQIDKNFHDFNHNRVSIETHSGEEREIKISRNYEDETPNEALNAILGGYVRLQSKRGIIGRDLERLFGPNIRSGLKNVLYDMMDGKIGKQHEGPYLKMLIDH